MSPLTNALYLAPWNLRTRYLPLPERKAEINQNDIVVLHHGKVTVTVLEEERALAKDYRVQILDAEAMPQLLPLLAQRFGVPLAPLQAVQAQIALEAAVDTHRKAFSQNWRLGGTGLRRLEAVLTPFARRSVALHVPTLTLQEAASEVSSVHETGGS